MSLVITGITLSVEFGDMEYGRGTKSFTSLHARVPEGEIIPVSDPGVAIDAGLDMYLTAWTTLMAGRRATGVVGKEDYDRLVPIMAERIAKLKTILKTPVLVNR